MELGPGTWGGQSPQEAGRGGWERHESGGFGPWEGSCVPPHQSRNAYLPTGLPQQLPVGPHGLLLVEGDQCIQRGVGALLPRDHEAAIIQELHHEVTAAALGSVETPPGLGHSTPQPSMAAA